jgi:hypothetical protein
MKRSILIVLVVLAAAPAPAEVKVLHNLQSATIGWEPTTMYCHCLNPPCTPTLECPAVGPAVGALYYQVYTKTDPNDTVGVKYGAATQQTRMDVTFPKGETIYVGVELVWWGRGLDTAQTSWKKSWSNVPADCDGEQTFGFRYVGPPPKKPDNVRVVD